VQFQNPSLLYTKRFYIVMVIMMAALITDYLLSNIADIISEQIKFSAGTVLFIVISVVSIAGQLYLLRILKTVMSKNQLRKFSLFSLRRIVEIIQYILMAILIVIILQVILAYVYLTSLLAISTTISYVLTIVIMGILAWKLLAWFRRSKNLALLLYGIAAVMIIFNAISSVILFDGILMKKPETVSAESEVIFDLGFDPGTPMSIVITSQSYSFSAFILMSWGGTIMILRHNIQRIGKVKFWVLVLLPIVGFLSYFVTFYQVLYPESTVTQALSENFAVPITIGSAAVSACGIFFGLGFLSIARSISSSNYVKNYMIVTSSGFMLFFTASSATVLQAAYPPFGLPNISMVGLSAYLIFFGLYYSAVAIANDVKLRQLIKKTLLDKSKLLDSIADAQMKQELEKSVFDTVRNNADRLERESGAPPAMTEDEISKYLQVVI
jgi:hypothetical protein